MSQQPIENHGVIGDLHTVALVAMDGSIDFLCLPRFDSPTVFAALLDDERGGRFRIAPDGEAGSHKQIYLPDSNVLLTRFLFESGVGELSDFMSIGDRDGRRRIVRRAKTVRGRMHYRLECAPRFDYGRARHRVERVSEHQLRFLSDGSTGAALCLRSSIPLQLEGGDACAGFTLDAGQSAWFVLEYDGSGEVSEEVGEHAPVTIDSSYVAESFKRTNDYWRGWVARSTYQGRWREMVNRSALTLKLLTSVSEGSIVAAPTFGLPEVIGGGRNWDYRYTWIRDASFTLYGLNRLGYNDEAAAFMRWLEARCDELAPDGSLQIMYGLDGRHDLVEEELPHLRGHQGSRPVRIGNGAARQVQLDIYGELMDSVYLYNKFGRPIAHDLWMNLTRLIDWVCAHWSDADEGIWEVRGGKQELLHSRVMCWVAVDRGLRIADKRSFPAPRARWLEVRDAIYRDVFESFWDAERGTFVQSKTSRTTDASMLLMPLMKFIAPTDARWLSTLRAIEQDLVEDSLVFRYRSRVSPDGLAGDEGTFTMCSFWYVEAVARSGDVDQARFLFEKMLGYANHVGLYAEELGPCGEHLGNFPQAFTHIALISAAHCLDRALSDAGRGR